MAAPTGTLERATEVVVEKSESPSDLAKTEAREKVEGSAPKGEPRAWNARAQVD